MRRWSLVAVMLLSLAVVSLSGCASESAEPAQSVSAKPQASGPLGPQAASYPTIEALRRAVSSGGGPATEPLSSGMSSRLPSASQYGAMLVAKPDGTLTLSNGTPATNVLGAFFPGTVPKAERDAFGGDVAKGLGWSSIGQLTGPNWVLWSIEHQTLLDLRAAIGGRLSKAFAPTAGE